MHPLDSRSPELVEREQHILVLLQTIHTQSITTKSDLARTYADEIAEAASRGFITTLVVPSQPVYGRLWKMTVAGLVHLNRWAFLIAADEVEDYERNHCQEEAPRSPD